MERLETETADELIDQLHDEMVEQLHVRYSSENLKSLGKFLPGNDDRAADAGVARYAAKSLI